MNIRDYVNDSFLRSRSNEELLVIENKLIAWRLNDEEFYKILDNWFCNFDTKDKQLAYKVLMKIDYYNATRFRDRIEQLWSPIARHLALTEDKMSNIVIVTPDDRGDSASRHAYDVIKTWVWPGIQVCSVGELDSLEFKYPIFVLFNDTHGTGNQFLSTIWPKLKKYKEHKIFVMAITIAEKALEDFTEKMPGVVILPGTPAQSAMKEFSGDECRRLKELGKEVYPKHPMGFGCTGLLAAYYFQCPNNSLPIIWANKKNNAIGEKEGFPWNPLFPYHPKPKYEKTLKETEERIGEKENDSLKDNEKTYPTIVNRSLADEIINLLQKQTPQWINLHGPSGHGKSTILFQLCRKIRNTNSLIDCVFSPLDNSEISKDTIEKGIYSRIGGHQARTAGSLSSLKNVSEVIERCESIGRKIVFMIDHCEKLTEKLNGIIAYFNQFFPQASVILVSRFNIKKVLAYKLPRQSIDYEVPVLSIEEAIDCLDKIKNSLSPHLYNFLIERLKGNEKLRHPHIVNSLALQISNEYDEVALANLINKAEGEDESLTINEMSEIIHLYSNIQNLTFELTAPVYLTKEILCCITSDDFGLDIAEGLLEKLFRYGYLDRYYPKYYLKDLYKGMLINRKKPSPKIFEKLIEFELSKDDFSYEQAINTLEYIDGAMFTERKRKMKILGVLDKLANNLSESSSLPSQPVLNKYFEAVRDDAKPKIMMLYARYKECQGKYEEGLEILNSLSGKEEVDQLKLKFLDKSGNFQGMLEIIKKYIGKDPNITPVAESPWNPAIVQYYGRYLQCTGSLAKALKTYELIEEFEDADVAIRIHSLIEQATICVFAEEPDLALNLLKKAERYTPSDDSEIFRHKIDVYRYLSRAYKLRANFHDNQDRIQDLKDAHKYKEKSKEMAIEYFYNEGLIWASVLEGRLAYFDDNFEVAINKFSEADWLINESSYYGAIPHLHRHMALAYAANKEFGNAKEHIIIAWKHTVKSKRLYMRGLITDTWAKLKVMEGNVESAKKLLRSAMNAYDKCGLFQPPFSRLRDRIQNSLEDPKYLLRENKIW